jgi:hypothetical protein
MHLMRYAALLAVLALSACAGGGSSTPFVSATGLPGTVVLGPQVRLVNGDLRVGLIDLTVTPTGPPNSALMVTQLPYAQATDFFTASAFSTVTMRPGGSGPFGTVLQVCTLPALVNNAVYSVVIADQTGIPNCMVFLDANYSGVGQYRVHYAAADAALVNFGLTSLAYGVATSLGATPLMQGVVPLGAFVNQQNIPTSSGTLRNQAPTGAAAFVIARVTSPGATLVPLAELSVRGVFAPGSFVQPDSLGVLPFRSYAGISLYAIDCTPSAIAAVPGSNAISCGPTAIALVGVFDTR